jgi:hypothetical protein
VAAAGLLVAAAVAAGFSTLDLVRRERAPAVVVTRPPSLVDLGGSPDPRPETTDGAPLVGPVLLVLLVVVALALVLWCGWAVLRRSRWSGGGRRRWFRLRALWPAGGVARSPGAPDPVALLAAVDRALAEDDRDPRRAVIACWVRLAEAAGDAGVPRYPSDTATDLVIRLLRGHQVSEPVLAAFAEAYRRARYATHTVDEQTRTQARSALRRLRAELRGPAPVPAAASPVPVAASSVPAATPTATAEEPGG